jgi:hypothetical protein
VQTFFQELHTFRKYSQHSRTPGSWATGQFRTRIWYCATRLDDKPQHMRRDK